MAKGTPVVVSSEAPSGETIAVRAIGATEHLFVDHYAVSEAD
ncbi:hypothetical protein [Bradyrhizobium genosp. P]